MTTEYSVAPWEEQLATTSCVIFESARSTTMGEWCSFFPDFGDAICFYRHLRISEELETLPSAASDAMADLPPATAPGEPSWSRYRSHFSNEEIRRRRYEGERALDKLLERFVRDGYQPDMGEKLIEIIAATLIDFTLLKVFVLPGDLAALLAYCGNPLIICDCDDDEAAGEATPLVFDLNTPGHRQALADHLIEPGI